MSDDSVAAIRAVIDEHDAIIAERDALKVELEKARAENASLRKSHAVEIGELWDEIYEAEEEGEDA